MNLLPFAIAGTLAYVVWTAFKPLDRQYAPRLIAAFIVALLVIGISVMALVVERAP